MIAILLATISTIFFGALYAITGILLNVQPFIQVNLLILEGHVITKKNIKMIGGFIHPGKPMANMYFVLYGYSKFF